MIMVTHIENIALLADKIIRMNSGKIVGVFPNNTSNGWRNRVVRMITFKKTIGSIGVIIICFSAMFLETLFISYKLDLNKLDFSHFTPASRVFPAQDAMCTMMNMISLGILELFSFVLLFFSVARYIEENRSNMGLLKPWVIPPIKSAPEWWNSLCRLFVGSLSGYLGALGFANPFTIRWMRTDNSGIFLFV